MAYGINSTNAIMGDNLFVYYAKTSGETTTWYPLAYSTSCSLSFSEDTIDAANKMDGVWTSNLPGKLSWEISTECLMVEGEDNLHYFYDSMKSREAFKIRFGQTSSVNSDGDADSSDDATFALDTTKVYYEGEAYLTSCEVSADNGSVASCSITLTGNGKLSKVKPTTGA